MLTAELLNVKDVLSAKNCLGQQHPCWRLLQTVWVLREHAMKRLSELAPSPKVKGALLTDSRAGQDCPLVGAQPAFKHGKVSITYKEAAVALAAHFRPHHMDMGNTYTVGVSCVEMPTALPRFPH